jgi:hypothetical protein
MIIQCKTTDSEGGRWLADLRSPESDSRATAVRYFQAAYGALGRGLSDILLLRQLQTVICLLVLKLLSSVPSHVRWCSQSQLLRQPLLCNCASSYFKVLLSGPCERQYWIKSAPVDRFVRCCQTGSTRAFKCLNLADPV